jgi:hypothetical protein
MAFSTWIRNWKRSVERRCVLYQALRKPAACRHVVQPRLEVLEDRCLLSTYIVTNTADSGTGSLRDAINQANNTASGITEIDFNIGAQGVSSGVQTISPGSPLPVLTAKGVFINGYSENQWQGVASTNPYPLIELNGASAGSSSDGLDLTGADDTVGNLIVEGFTNGIVAGGANDAIGDPVSGLGNVISGNTGDGLQITASGVTVLGNYIGTDTTGTKALPNGVGILVSANNVTIGGPTGIYTDALNIIAGNRGDGVYIASGVSGVAVLGNSIGNADTAAEGNIVLANGVGVELAGSNNTVGGSGYGGPNVISGNTGDGVLIDSGATGNQVFNNTIGLDVTGQVVLSNNNGIEVAGNNNQLDGNIIAGNSNDGVLLDSGSSGDQVFGNDIGYINGHGTTLPNKVGIEDAGSGNTIGSSVPNAGNLISGNSGDGVLLDSTATAEEMWGNYIGIKLYGDVSQANSGNGVEVKGSGNTIGGNSGTNSNVRNFISGNSGDGVLIDSGATGNQVQGDWIGANTAGTAALANSIGVEVVGNSNTIGGTAGGVGNVISGNKGDGVLLDSTGAGNVIQGSFVGTDYTGQKALANSGNGIEIQGTGNTVSAGNILAGNSKDGVLIGSSASGTLVQGNYLGLNALGAALANGGNGIEVAGNSNTVGGTVTAARNIISGNGKDGVLIDSASGNQVLGNYIGTNIGGITSVANSIGVEIAGSSNTIGGSASGALNLISGNTNDGVKIDSGASANLVEDSAIGVNVYENAVVGNSGNGIEVAGNNNTVGASWAVAPNVISGNSNDGVFLDSGSSGNQVLGNYIGTNDAGTAAVANKVGIEDGGSSNTIGGSVLGARNVISGNSSDGVLLDSSASAESMWGNYIGTDVSGGTALANGTNGVEVQGTGNTIGGNPYSDYFFRNFISGNGNDGVLFDSGGSGNQVLGNFIGIGVSGTNGVSNVANAIEIAGSSNTIGGTISGNQNVLSGSGNDGVLIDSTAANNLLQGNFVGTDYTGTSAVANSGNGIEVLGTGTTVDAGNIIAGNGKDGVRIGSSGGTLVQGNYLGINASGAALGNSGNGVNIAGNNNTIGGTVTAARNIISGNGNDGVLIASDRSDNQVLGNYIGTNIGGTASVANSIGVDIAGSSNTVGGSASGALNLISGNSNDGVKIDSGGSSNQVLGNAIGVNVYDSGVVGNSGNGVEVAGNNNTVGASWAVAPNEISGNSNDGVLLDSGSSGNQVLGNYIGTNLAGTTALANKVGVEDAGKSNTIGGSVLGARNLISGNTGDGVLNDSTATGELIESNYIGLNVSATTALANGGNGIEVQGTGNTVGGNSGINFFTRNYIGGNTKDGVLFDSGASGNQVLGNFIGVDITGTNGVGNVTNAIEIAGSSNTIGGTTHGVGNVLSGSGNDGVLIDSTGTKDLLQGNFAGTDYTGTSAVANSGNGIEIAGNNNTVGGTTSGAGNVISGNSKDGVLVSAGSGNTISQNSIFANAGLGISLASGANNNIPAPTLSSATLSSGTLTVTGTFTATTTNPYVLEFFANPSGDAEGKIYLFSKTVTPASAGTVNFTLTTTNTSQLGTYPLITATLTDDPGDTSEFSAGATVS